MTLLPDIQKTPDTRGIYIDEVGVQNVKYPLVFKNGKNNIFHTIANIDLTVSLDEKEKGTHMSRFISILNDTTILDCSTLLDEFMTKLLVSLGSERAYFNAKFTIFFEKQSPVTKLPGLMDYECTLRAVKTSDGTFERLFGIKVNATSLCPCSKEISKYGAHNQRSTIGVYVRPIGDVDIELYYSLVDICEKNASCELYSVLKRDDEKAVTERAYENPKFVEDIVRDVSTTLINNEYVKWFSVTSTNHESIHNHDAFARIERGLKSDLLDPPTL